MIETQHTASEIEDDGPMNGGRKGTKEMENLNYFTYTHGRTSDSSVVGKMKCIDMRRHPTSDTKLPRDCAP